MRDKYQTVFEHFFREQLLQERARLELTQLKMSELLLISLRSYSYIECGETSCSALTLVLFLIYCCEDRIRFFKELEQALEDTYAAI